jgi:hypothetical protein
MTEEKENIIKFAIKMAQCGFSLSPQRLKDYYESIVQHKLGDGFPEKNWEEIVGTAL